MCRCSQQLYKRLPDSCSFGIRYKQIEVMQAESGCCSQIRAARLLSIKASRLLSINSCAVLARGTILRRHSSLAVTGSCLGNLLLLGSAICNMLQGVTNAVWMPLPSVSVAQRSTGSTPVDLICMSCRDLQDSCKQGTAGPQQ